MICVKVQYSVEGVTPIRYGGSVANALAHLAAKMALISVVPNKRKGTIVLSSFLFLPLHFFILRSTCIFVTTRVGTFIVATIYLQLIQNRYMFRSFTVLQCSHQHCLQPVASDVEVAGYL